MNLCDLIGGTGLALLGTGLWLVYPPASMIVIGAVLFAVALAGALRGSRGSRRRPVD